MVILVSTVTNGMVARLVTTLNITCTYVKISYKTQQEQVTSKKTNLSTIRFRRVMDNSKQDVTTYCGVPALILRHLIVMDC